LHSLAECFGVRQMIDAKAKVDHALRRGDRAHEPLDLEITHPHAPSELAWPVAERLAVTYLHLGDPESARQIWKAATAPRPAIGLARLAQADLAALDPAKAMEDCRAALELDPKLGEAWFALAMAALESGQAQTASEACRRGLNCELTTPQRDFLVGAERLLGRQ
jgi:tetratricopeptide (TPR) repeat protein